MQTNFALNPPAAPAEHPATVDLLITLRPEPPAEPRAPRRPFNLSLVIDRSGSMAGRSLQQALQAAEAVVEQLGPDDVLSVVVYDNTVDTLLPPGNVTDKQAIRETLHRVRTGGTTNLSGGWLKGCEHVLARRGADMIHRVLLLTDGQANVGVTNPDILIATARQKADEGVVTTTLGFGLLCTRMGGKLRVRVASEGYDQSLNIQFPRSIREEGVHYVVDTLQLAANGTFYRAGGQIRRLALPGQEHLYKGTSSRSRATPARRNAPQKCRSALWRTLKRPRAPATASLSGVSAQAGSCGSGLSPMAIARTIICQLPHGSKPGACP